MKTIKKIFLRWEWLLMILTVGVFFFFNDLDPKAYTLPKLMGQTRVYMVDVGFMALGALLILLLGDIDISVASTAGLAATIMGITYRAGAPFWVALIAAVAVGAVCGAINGFLVTGFKELFPMIITLSTQTIYRGINYIILKDKSVGSFPEWFGDLGYDTIRDAWFAKDIPGWISGGPEWIQWIYNFIGDIPVMLICLLFVFPFFYVWIHKTASGRRIFATGENIVTARYSGIRTDRMKIFLFTLNGILAAVGGIFLAARTGSVKYTHANGYEMQAIAVAVLGGASTAGGKGSVVGILLSLILMTCLKNGLNIVYNDSFIMNLSVGALLILVVLLPNIAQFISDYWRVLKRRKEAATKASPK